MKTVSQSLSGWDGVFHLAREVESRRRYHASQSLSGWDGVFHRRRAFWGGRDEPPVAIPFRVGWGFSLTRYIRWK